MAVGIKTEKFFEPLARLSYDEENDVVVCPYRNEFLDFDALKMALHRQKPAKSPDMLFCHEGKKEIWFVEFKSSSQANLHKQRFDLKRKALDGLIQLYELFQKYFDYKKYYVVVFPREESAEEEVMNDLSMKKQVLFDLEELQGKFFQAVLTDNCDALKHKFYQRFEINFQEGTL